MRPAGRLRPLLLRGAAAVVVLVMVLLADSPSAPAQAAKGPEVVTIGVFVQNMSDVDLRTGTVVADFYLWFRWRGDIDPTLTYEFTNAVRNDLTAQPGSMNEDKSPKTQDLDDGQKYQVFHVQGQIVQTYRLNDYPLDAHNLAISVEDVQHDAGSLVYVIDRGSQMRPGMTMTGWHPQALRTRLSENTYTTDFGFPGGENSVFSHADFTVRVERRGIGGTLQSIAPLLVIIFVALVSLLIHPQAFEALMALATPALIAAVFLHYTALSGLPSEGGMMLLDRIYLLSYIVILLVIATGVFSHRLCGRDRLDKALVVDRVSLSVLVAVFVLGTALLFAFR